VVTAALEGLFLDAPMVVADELGFLKEEGIELKTVQFSTATESFPPLTTGEIDLKVGTLSPVLFNAIARGIDIKVVSETGYQAGSAPMGLLVRTDLMESGRYKTPADLKGMKIGVPSRYGLTEYFLKVLLEKEGLSMQDIDVVAAGTADALAALAGKSLDADINVEPFVSTGERQGMAKVPVRADQVVPDLPTAVVMMSSQFYAKKDLAQAS
jgi:NitT/TauT family transport system substrate-binding protein